jgi:hypothetical protein
MDQEEFTSHARNSKELSRYYGVDPKTFRKWLRIANLNLGPRLGNFFSPRQVKIIVEHLSRPFIFVFMQLARFFDEDDYSLSSDNSEARKPVKHKDLNQARVDLVCLWFNRVRLALSILL